MTIFCISHPPKMLAILSKTTLGGKSSWMHSREWRPRR